MSRRNLLFSHGDGEGGRPAWVSAIRIPSASAPDELMHTAQCAEIMRPLLPLLAATTLIYTAYAALEAWPPSPFPAALWVALGLAAGGAIGLGGTGKRVAASPVATARTMAASAAALGVLFGLLAREFGDMMRQHPPWITVSARRVGAGWEFAPPGARTRPGSVTRLNRRRSRGYRRQGQDGC